MNEDYKLSKNEPGASVPASAGDPRIELRAAVEHLYMTFEPYNRLSAFVGCQCGTCVTDEQNVALHARPLRLLTPEDLKPVGNSTFVLTTDLKHLLPRIAELVAEGHRDFANEPAEFLFRTCERFEGWNGWRTAWPPHERDAVDAFVFALWRDALAGSPEQADAGEVIHIIAQLFEDLGPFLAIWQSEVTTSSMLQVLALIEENTVEIGIYHRLSRTFWLDRVRSRENQLLAWLLNLRTEQAIVQAYREQRESARLDRETFDAVVAQLTNTRMFFYDIEYFIRSFWDSGSPQNLHRLKVFVENHIDRLRTTGRLHSRLLSRSEADPWRGREADERKVIAWLLRPETAQLLREYRAANPVPYPSKAPEQLDELRAEWARAGYGRGGRDS